MRPVDLDREGPADATRTLPGAAAAPGTAAYLLVFEEATAATFPLPQQGQVRIGRAEDCDLVLSDPAASRTHARLLVGPAELALIDEGSHNGTRVNGERVDGSRLLLSGDVVTVGGATLILHRDPRRAPPALALFDHGRLRQHLIAESDRCRRYGRTLALVAVYLGTQPAELPTLLQAIGAHLRPMDLATWDGPDLLLLLPELSGEAAAAVARGLATDLLAGCPGARVGLARCPEDAQDPDALIAAAREACRGAAPGGHALAAAKAPLRIGDREVVVIEPAMVQAFERIRRAATSPLPILLYGETGTGKELAALAVHAWSHRAAGPFVAVNCAALPEGLLESELFGHQRGAFTGARADKLGLLESAHEGTLLLDEIGELPLQAQAKLPRALETQRVQRVGSVRERPIDIRVVAATHRDLRAEVQAGRFRQDLYYRLRGAEVILPPLRDRPRELPALARALLQQACARAGRPAMEISTAALQALLAHPFPGNVRELKHVMEFVAATVSEPLLLPGHLEDALGGPAPAAPGPGEPPAPERSLGEELRGLERRRIQEALAACGFVQVRAAELLGFTDRTLRRKLKELQIPARPPGAPPPGGR